MLCTFRHDGSAALEQGYVFRFAVATARRDVDGGTWDGIPCSSPDSRATDPPLMRSGAPGRWLCFPSSPTPLAAGGDSCDDLMYPPRSDRGDPRSVIGHGSPRYRTNDRPTVSRSGRHPHGDSDPPLTIRSPRILLRLETLRTVSPAARRVSMRETSHAGHVFRFVVRRPRPTRRRLEFGGAGATRRHRRSAL